MKKSMIGLALVAATAWAGGRDLKHYKSDISPEALKNEMKSLKKQVGGKCTSCHEPNEWAKETEKKTVAIAMLGMTKKIGEKLFTNEYFPEEGPPRAANCVICHKGKTHVATEPDPKNEAEMAAAKKFDAMIERTRHQETVAGMKKLVEELNKNFFTWKDAPKATCWMCHRGSGHVNTRMPKLGEDDEEEKGVDWTGGAAKPRPEKKPADDDEGF